MDPQRFDRLAITLTHARTRRSLLGLLGALGLTALANAEARATHTPGDCRHNGVRCTAGTQCCSGRCVRKPGTTKNFCRQAPSQGICTIESNVCADGGGGACGDAGAGSACSCFVTTRGHSFCGGVGRCFACKADTQCENREGGQRGDRCVQGPDCCGSTNNRVCVPKCPNPATA